MTRLLLALALLCLPGWVGAAVSEGQSFTLDQPGRVVYGAGTAWVAKDLAAGTYTCGNALFSDPLWGTVKTCQLPVPEGHAMRASGGPVWYGSGSRFTVKTLAAGNYVCGNTLFGDPAPGAKKQCYATSMLDNIDCYPAQLGGTGSRAAWGVSLSPVQAWAGWWCAGRVQIVACTGSGCVPDAARRVLSTTSDTINAEMQAARTERIDSDRLRTVWAPHWPEIAGVKP